MSSSLVTSWGNHPNLPTYLDFLEWGLGHAPTVQAYRLATGDKWLQSPSGDGREAFLQRFSDWVEANLYGKPEDFLVNGSSCAQAYDTGEHDAPRIRSRPRKGCI